MKSNKKLYNAHRDCILIDELYFIGYLINTRYKLQGVYWTVSDDHPYTNVRKYEIRKNS